jgi:MFS family permease
MASTFSGIKRLFSNRNYQLFIAGQFTSLIGTWITATATSWLVFRLTGSEALLGVASFSSQILSFVFAPIAGVMVDRWNLKTLLIVTQCGSLLQSMALALLMLYGQIGIWSICLLNAAQGFLNAFDMPGRQAFMYELVEEKSDLPNAIALNAAMFHGARFLGPPIAGLIIAAWHEGACFLIDALSYLAVICSLFLIVLPAGKRVTAQHNLLEGLKGGWKHVREFAPIRDILLLVAAVCLVGTSYIVLLPVFANEILHGQAGTLGMLMAASGAGAVAGALYLATRGSILGRGKIIVSSGVGMGAGSVVFAFSTSLWLSMALLFVMGGTMMMMLASCNTIIQMLVDDDKRGRVMSFYLMAFMGATPTGSLIAGILASHIGTPITVAISGVSCIFVTLLFALRLPALREAARPMYIKLGIIPDPSVHAPVPETSKPH